MTNHRRVRTLIGTVLCAGMLVVAALWGLNWARARVSGETDAKTLAAIRRLEKVWVSFPDRHAGKTEYGRACGALGAAIADSSTEELRGMVRYLASEFSDSPNTQPRREFEINYLGALHFLIIERLIRNRDREQLLYVLTRVPTDRIGFASVETALGYDFSVQYQESDPWKPDDLFTVLFDVYEQAETPGARSSSLAAIQRSFRDQPGDPEGGDVYVASCRDWFRQNFSRIEASKDHVYVYGDEPWAQVKPLFIIMEQSKDP